MNTDQQVRALKDRADRTKDLATLEDLARQSILATGNSTVDRNAARRVYLHIQEKIERCQKA